MMGVAIPSRVRSEDGMGKGVMHKRTNGVDEVEGALYWITNFINYKDPCFHEFCVLFIELVVEMDDDKLARLIEINIRGE
jgi:hypothetical protein